MRLTLASDFNRPVDRYIEGNMNEVAIDMNIEYSIMYMILYYPCTVHVQLDLNRYVQYRVLTVQYCILIIVAVTTPQWKVSACKNNHQVEVVMMVLLTVACHLSSIGEHDIVEAKIHMHDALMLKCVIIFT